MGILMDFTNQTLVKTLIRIPNQKSQSGHEMHIKHKSLSGLTKYIIYIEF